jgi:hypothetical protein
MLHSDYQADGENALLPEQIRPSGLGEATDPGPLGVGSPGDTPSAQQPLDCEVGLDAPKTLREAIRRERLERAAAQGGLIKRGRGAEASLESKRFHASRERILRAAGFDLETIRSAIDTCRVISTDSAVQARERVMAARTLLGLLPRDSERTGPKRLVVSIEQPDWLQSAHSGAHSDAHSALLHSAHIVDAQSQSQSHSALSPPGPDPAA